MQRVTVSEYGAYDVSKHTGLFTGTTVVSVYVLLRIASYRLEFICHPKKEEADRNGRRLDLPTLISI